MRSPARPGPRRPDLVLLCLATLLLVAGCIHSYREMEQSTMETQTLASPVGVDSPIRAHLTDGSVVIYRTGAQVDRDAVRGSGMWYDPLRQDSAPADDPLAMSRVLGLESFSTTTNSSRSAVVSLAATTGMAVLAIGGMVAIACINDPKCFGSCPTVYTMTAEGEVLEAELFSYSVAPLLEGRDIDLLGAAADSSGIVRMEIRNEALETHYINHLELLEVRHAQGESVVPDDRGRPLVVSSLTPTVAYDRTGRNVSAELMRSDSLLYTTSAAVLAGATLDDLRDHIDLVAPMPTGVDSVAVVMRVRNSLLNSLLFYDMMLGSAGATALDWMGSDLQRIGPAVELGQWYASRFGMWVSVEQDGEFVEVTRVPDTGPIAWKDIAVLVPVPASGDSLRIRLSFVMDEWRIDRVALARSARRAEPRTVVLSRAINADGADMPDALMRLSEPDELYVETGPGHYFTLEFNAGRAPVGTSRTFLLSSLGYYTEWIRPDWVRTAHEPAPFRPRDETLLVALERWQEVKPEFEGRFYDTRIPVR